MSSLTAQEEVNRMAADAFALRMSSAVLVEGKDDVRFWEKAFMDVGYLVRVFKFSNYPSVGASGSTTIERHYQPLVSNEFRVCLDTDFNYTVSNKRQRYVNYTHLHSIESFYAYPRHLKSVLNGSRGVSADLSLIQMLTDRYSELLYPNLIQWLDTSRRHGRPALDKPDFMELKSMSRIEPAVLNHPIYLPCAPSRTIYFMRGHDVLKKWTFPLLRYLEKPLVNERLTLMSNLERQAYSSLLKQNRFTLELLQNTECRYSEMPEYQQILQDIRNDV